MLAESSQGLCDWIMDVLKDTPSGVTEYELLTGLRENEFPEFENFSFQDNLSLFKAHFQLFNALYQLRKHLRQGGQACLEISPLKIVLLPYNESESREITEHDPLGDYYTDTSHLHETTEAEIDAMLEIFWMRLSNSDQRQQALKIIGLEDPVGDKEIKQQYRRLVMQHHPDRGGDKEKLQEINTALSMLM